MTAVEHKPPKIPKGFVLVNLSTWEQEELRSLARECGIKLSDAFRWALFSTRQQLKEDAEIKRKTGRSKRDLGLVECLGTRNN